MCKWFSKLNTNLYGDVTTEQFSEGPQLDGKSLQVLFTWLVSDLCRYMFEQHMFSWPGSDWFSVQNCGGLRFAVITTCNALNGSWGIWIQDDRSGLIYKGKGKSQAAVKTESGTDWEMV